MLKIRQIMSLSSSRNIILASQSKQRKLLIQALNIKFEVIPSHIDEQKVQEKDLAKRAQKIARLKAEKVAGEYPDSIIIAGDSYGSLQGERLEKPGTKEQAIKMLELQSGQWIKAITGFCYIDRSQNIFKCEYKITQVKFRKLDDYEIRRYVASNPVTTWSAGFAPTYPSGAALIEATKGSFTGFTYGLPIENLMPLLQQSTQAAASQ